MGQAQRYLAPMQSNRRRTASAVLAAVLTLAVVAPVAPPRLRALQDGAATFVKQNYAYPVDDLQEPRRVAAVRLRQLPERALAITDWRALYAMYYLAHAEGERPDVAFMEATPHGARGRIADSLIQTLQEALRAGQTVVADRDYPNLSAHFHVQLIPGSGWYSLSLSRISRNTFTSGQQLDDTHATIGRVYL
jgi:hypothetical protein